MRFEFIYMIIFTLLSWASDPLVKLMEQPQLHEGQPVYLQDIALIEGGDRQMQDQLGKLLIASTTHELKKGNPLLLQIRNQLNEFKKQCQCQVQLQVPRNFSVAHAGEKKSSQGQFTEDKLKQVIIEKAKANCENCRIEVQAMRCTQGETPTDESAWDVQAQLNKAGGDNLVQVYFSDKAKPIEYIVNLKIESSAVKLKTNVPLGASVEESMVETLWVTPTPMRTAATFKDLATAELKRSLSAGQIIYLDDLRERHIVRSGRTVKVEIVKGSMILETTGTPVKDAKMGDYIPVRLTKSNKNVVAEVVSPGKVRVQ